MRRAAILGTRVLMKWREVSERVWRIYAWA